MMEKKQFIPKKKAQGKDATEYQERAKQEAERFRLATDSEFWLCVCFKEEKELRDFRERFGIDGRFVDSESFEKALSSVKPEKRKQGFPGRPTGAKAEHDPLASVEYSGDLEADCIAEAMALFECMRKAKSPDPCKHATDSEHWICAAFPSRDDKESFLTEWNLWRYGDKYLDGTAWLKSM